MGAHRHRALHWSSSRFTFRRMETIFEALLPSGRGVRYQAVTTAIYMDAHETACDRFGGSNGDTRTAAWQEKLNKRIQSELVARCVREVSLPLDLKTQPGKPDEPDIDATLEQAPASAWSKVSYVELTTEGGAHSIAELFRSPVDFFAMASLVERTMAPARDLKIFTGKVRSRSS